MEDESSSCLTNITLSSSSADIKKRQLPQWMLGLAGSEIAKQKDSAKHINSKKSETPVGEHVVSEGFHAEKRKKPRKVTTKSTKIGDSARKRGPPKLGVKNDGGDDSHVQDGEKRVEKSRKKTVSKKGRARSKKESVLERQDKEDSISEFEEDMEQCEGIEVHSEMDLSMEDLLNIAKQHVEAVEQSGVHGKREDTKANLQEPDKTTKKASIFSNDEWKDLSYNLKCSEVPSSANENIGNDLSKSNIGKEENFTLTTQSERNIVLSPEGRPDDVAQNMLDLLLGPSLTCFQNEDKKSVTLLDELNSVSQFTEPESRTEEAPIFKKKSSLRDKVTMLLN